MSKEATGQFNTKIGSSGYWGRLNRGAGLDSLMGDRTNYRTMLHQLGTRANGAIEEIYTDLSELGGGIRRLSASDRKALAKQVEELYDVCRMAGVTAKHSSECIQGLNLSAMSPWSGSFRNEQDIEKAIAVIEKSRYPGNEAVKLLKEAARWGITSAAERDPKKREFLQAVSLGNGDRFLQAVAEEYQSRTGSQRREGRGGQTVASRAYRNQIELQVFGYVLPGFGEANYERMLRDALSSVAEQLDRDLDNAIRENDYITDETAAKLKAAASELGQCGVNTGSLNSKIEKLAWFVGGDPSKIRKLQKALNDLGVGQNVKEDGVYGEETKKAIGKMIDGVSEFLTDPEKIRRLSKCIDLCLLIRDSSNGFQTAYWRLRQVLKVAMPILQRTVWKWGAEHYLRPKGYEVAALLLEHSLNNSPQDLYFSNTHWVAQKVLQSNGFKEAFAELEKRIQTAPDIYAVDGVFVLNFQKSNDTDLYYGLGVVEVKYTCVRSFSSVQVKFTLEDRYDFDHIRTICGDMERFIKFEFGLGNLANDAGLISQADGVISTYYSHISFDKTIGLI